MGRCKFSFLTHLDVPQATKDETVERLEVQMGQLQMAHHGESVESI